MPFISVPPAYSSKFINVWTPPILYRQDNVFDVAACLVVNLQLSMWLSVTAGKSGVWTQDQKDAILDTTILDVAILDLSK